MNWASKGSLNPEIQARNLNQFTAWNPPQQFIVVFHALCRNGRSPFCVLPNWEYLDLSLLGTV